MLKYDFGKLLFQTVIRSRYNYIYIYKSLIETIMLRPLINKQFHNQQNQQSSQDKQDVYFPDLHFNNAIYNQLFGNLDYFLNMAPQHPKNLINIVQKPLVFEVPNKNLNNSSQLVFSTQIFQQYKETTFKFITIMDIRDTDAAILVSSEPIYAENDCSYFLLHCKSRKEKLIQFCYIVSQVVYLSAGNIQASALLKSLKAIKPFWKHTNILILLKEHFRRTLSDADDFGHSTAAQTRYQTGQQHYKQIRGRYSKYEQVRTSIKKQNSLIDKKLITNPIHLSKINLLNQYFTRIITKNSEGIDINLLLNHFLSLELQKGHTYKLQSIQWAIENCLKRQQNLSKINQQANKRKLSIHSTVNGNQRQEYSLINTIDMQALHNLNIKYHLEHITNQTLSNYQQIVQMQLKQGSTYKQEQIRTLLTTVSQRVIENFQGEALEFIYEQSYRLACEKVRAAIQQQQQQILSLIQRFNSEYARRKFMQFQNQEYIDFDMLIGMQPNSLKNNTVNFQTYYQNVLSRIDGVFSEMMSQNIKHKKKKEKGWVRNDQDILENLLERVAIYRSKKNSLQQAIKLAKKEEEKLLQMKIGLQLAINPTVPLNNRDSISGERMFTMNLNQF